MLAYGALRQGQHSYYFTTNTFILFGQHLQDGKAGRVAHRFGKNRQGLLFTAELFFFMKGHVLILYRKYTINKLTATNFCVKKI